MTNPILVFGAGGQLGQEILAQAATRGISVSGAVRAKVDVTHMASVYRVIAEITPRLVVNAAAYAAVDRAEDQPDVARLTNVTGAAIVARATATSGIPLIHLSTDYVFDGRKSGPYIESDLVAPLNVYGQSKAEGETNVRAAAPRHIILRTAWVYGRFGRNFLKTVLCLARERPELRIVADQHGSPTATVDLAAAIFEIDAAIQGGRDIPWGTYHFAGTEATSWHGLAEAIVAAQAPATGLRPPVMPVATADYPATAQRPLNSELDSTRFAAVFGYRAASWRERVHEIVAASLNPMEVRP